MVRRCCCGLCRCVRMLFCSAELLLSFLCAAADNTILSALDKVKKDTDKLAKQDFSSITAFQSQATAALSNARNTIVKLGDGASK